MSCTGVMAMNGAVYELALFVGQPSVYRNSFLGVISLLF